MLIILTIALHQEFLKCRKLLTRLIGLNVPSLSTRELIIPIQMAFMALHTQLLGQDHLRIPISNNQIPIILRDTLLSLILQSLLDCTTLSHQLPTGITPHLTAKRKVLW